MIPIPARRVAPSAYSLDTRIVEYGDVIENRMSIGTETFKVVSEPFHAGYCVYTARVREIGGHHDGNEFTAYLHTR